MKFIFVIEDTRDGSSGIYLVTAHTEEGAYRKLHGQRLSGKYDEWEDLVEDVENGEQIMYPARESIEIS